MFGNNDDNSSTDDNREYAVIVDGDEYDVYDALDVAEFVADELDYDHRGAANIKIEEREVESDEEDDLEYVVFLDGEEVDVFDNEEEAQDVADDLEYDYPFGTIEVEAQEPVEAAEDNDELPSKDSVYSFLEQPTLVGDLEESGSRWSLGSHSSPGINKDSIESMLDGLDPQVDDDLRAVLQQASGMVGAVEVSNFECGVCGLNHGHSDDKHDIRDDPETSPGFNVKDEFTVEMQFVPFCHCGLNELAMLMDFYGYSQGDVFKDGVEFSAATEAIPNEALQDICRVVRESPRDKKFEDAVKGSRYARLLGQDGDLDDQMDALERFYARWVGIKDAAAGAPITAETRTEIEEFREMAEEAVSK